MSIDISSLDSSPIGKIFVAANRSHILSIALVDTAEKMLEQMRIPNYQVNQESPVDNPIIRQSLRQLEGYLEGGLRTFDLPINWSGMSDFQKKVLEETSNIQYGQTATYGEIARRIGKLNAARAVGRIEAGNPLPILIPCHRVIGTDGKLHGYGGRGGIRTKEWLLRHEGVLLRKYL